MAETRKQVEAVTTYPDAPGGLSDAAAALDPNFIWARIEAYTAHRWSVRDVVWTVEGEGPWEAPLFPATLESVEVWESGGWTDCTPAASPWGGYDLPGDGPYRITAEVGAGPVPAAAQEAFRRLAEYSVEIGEDGMVVGHPSHTSHDTEIGSAIKESFTRSPTWAARALQLSGAADLLRPYRRA